MKIIFRLHLVTLKQILNNLSSYAKDQKPERRGKIRLITNKLTELVEMMEQMYEEEYGRKPKYEQHEL